MADDNEIKDDSKIVWERLYTKVYAGKLLGDKFDLNKISKNRTRYVAKARSSKLGDAEISGETDFNFSENPIRSNTTRAVICCGIIETIDDEQKKKKAKELLEYCKDMTYSFENFSLMLCTGSLQTIKGNFTKFDRIDTFLYLLDNYYKGIDELVLSHCSYGYLPILKHYLSLFADQKNPERSIYRYCQEIYHIRDTRFIDEMISMGKHTLDTPDMLIAYMKMAKKFWGKKAEYYRQMGVLP